MIGPNGAGKTTLLRMITGQEAPDAGKITVGSTVELAYVDQSRDTLDADATVWEEISDGLETTALRQPRPQQPRLCGELQLPGHGSAEESRHSLRRRAQPRSPARRPSSAGANVLLLDEPTNDLDVNTLRALEEALEVFAGCAIVVSHDRWFLDRIATHILAFEEDGTIHWFEGNFSDYEVDRKKRLGPAAEMPHRLRHRKLQR